MSECVGECVGECVSECVGICVCGVSVCILDLIYIAVTAS